MRQFRRPTPTPTTLTALRALAGVLVTAAVLSAPVHITAAQPAEEDGQQWPAVVTAGGSGSGEGHHSTLTR